MTETTITDTRDVTSLILSAAKGTINQRIFTIVGPNGSGKSRLLKHIYAEHFDNGSFVIVPSDRSLIKLEDRQLPGDVLECDFDGMHFMRLWDKVDEKRGHCDYGLLLKQLIRGALNLNKQRDAKFRDDIFQWATSDDCNDNNKKPTPPKDMV
jgi:energy-coupling factor transporter ATP-binding protein EcfA2